MQQYPLIRKATRDDVDAIVQLLSNDPLGMKREQYGSPLPESYYAAFDTIDADAHNELVVADLDGTLVGTLQLTIIPYLTYRGRSRAQIEAVRVREDQRGRGLGAELIRWAIDRARARGCHLVQLTSDKERTDALRFYEGLGFRATHEGFKLHF